MRVWGQYWSRLDYMAVFTLFSFLVCFLVCLFPYLFVCLFVCLFVSLFVCLFALSTISFDPQPAQDIKTF
jgi:hypothetical protein